MRVWDVGSHFGHEERVALMAFVDADAALRTGEAREDAGQEEPLEVERDVERVRLQQRARFFELVPAAAQVEVRARLVHRAAVPDEQAVDVGIRFEQQACGRAREPGDFGIGEQAAQIVDDARDVEHVADGADADDEDAQAVFLRVRFLHGIRSFEVDFMVK